MLGTSEVVDLCPRHKHKRVTKCCYLRAIVTDGMRPQADNDGWLNYLPSALTTLRTVTLLSTSLLCAAVAWLGGTLLFYILLSRFFSPAAAHHERSLYFDYTKADAVATAHFLPESQYNRAYDSGVSTVSLMDALLGFNQGQSAEDTGQLS